MRESQGMNIPIKPAITLLIDADACPVKDEVYRVMNRYQLKTFVVANRFFSFQMKHSLKEWSLLVNSIVLMIGS